MFRINPDVLKRIAWGRPDSPQRPLCGLCHGALPDVPLILMRDAGEVASFCDACVDEVLEAA